MKLTLTLTMAAVVLLAVALVLEGLRWLTWVVVGLLVIAAFAALLRARRDDKPAGPPQDGAGRTHRGSGA